MDTVLDFIHNFMFSEAAAVGVLKKPELITSVTRLSPTGYCESGGLLFGDLAQPGILAGQRAAKGVGRIASWG